MFGDFDITPAQHESWCEITRTWPGTQPHLANLLRAAACLHTWDAFSMLNYEAVLCGCIPVIRRYAPWTADEISQCEVPFPHLDNDNRSISDTDFGDQRDTMAGTLAALERTWPDRVNAVAELAEERFR